MKKLIVNFFGEEITIETPKSLTNLKQEISNNFCFSLTDASEILISYKKDLKKTFIETEQDFKNFVRKCIYKVDLDISQESQLFKKSIINLKEEIDNDKKELEMLIKKEEELKKKKEEINNENLKKIKEMREMIKELNREKYKLIKQFKKEKYEISGEISKIHIKIEELQVKLNLPITVEEKKEKSRPKIKKGKIISKIKIEKKKLFEKKQKEEKDIFVKFNEDINKNIKYIRKFILENLRKKTKELEIEKKRIEDLKIELKEEEVQVFLDFSLMSQNISEEIKNLSNFIIQHTNEFSNAFSKKYKKCLDIITSIKEKENEKLRINVCQKSHEEIKCKGCGICPISGSKFKCTICQDFEYCEKCKENNSDIHKHPFISFK